MRVLILSSNNGGGHNAVARALTEVFEAHGDVCRVEDCLSFISEDVSQAVAKSHNFMYRHAPKLFDSGYRHSRRHPQTFMEHHNGRRVLNLGRKNLGRFMRDGGFDAVLCTHVFASLMVTDARRKYGLTVRAGVVETDYTATPGTQAGGLDWHFIPAGSLRPELEALGVAPSKIVASGIPVRTEFYTREDRAAVRRALELPEDCRHILLMGGSMGAGPVPELVAELVRNMNGNTFVTVVCGTNRSLLDQLRAVYGGDHRIRPLGYAENISMLMDASELLLTKPGGITTTEAAVKRLPMVLVNTVAGCEGYNLDFFVSAGGAVTADNPQSLARLALAVLRDDAWQADMARALNAIAIHNDREIIWRYMAEGQIIGS